MQVTKMSVSWGREEEASGRREGQGLEQGVQRELPLMQVTAP